ncbi:MAG: hypothetical protein ACYDB1_09580 [Acidiferrobacteraceae bacterium]
MASTLVEEAVQTVQEGGGYYNASPMANVLDHIAGEGFADEETGDASEWYVWAAYIEFDEEDFAYLVEKGMLDAKNQCGWTLTIDDHGFRHAKEGREMFDAIDADYGACLEQNEAIGEAYQALKALEAEETGRCDSCEVCMINGFRCHETGCPREARLRSAQKRLQSLEDY